MDLAMIIARNLGAGLWAFARSRPGVALLAGALAYVWGASAAREACAAREAGARLAQAQAYAQELAREQEAAQRLAADATARAVDDAALARALQAKIDDYAQQERSADNAHARPMRARAQVSPRPCLVDDGFARVLRDLDAAADRAPASARRAR